MSAPRPGALAIIFSLEPGTERQERRGRLRERSDMGERLKRPLRESPTVRPSPAVDARRPGWQHDRCAELVGRLAGGEGAGAYEVRTADGAPRGPRSSRAARTSTVERAERSASTSSAHAAIRRRRSCAPARRLGVDSASSSSHRLPGRWTRLGRRTRSATVSRSSTRQRGVGSCPSRSRGSTTWSPASTTAASATASMRRWPRALAETVALLAHCARHRRPRVTTSTCPPTTSSTSTSLPATCCRDGDQITGVVDWEGSTTGDAAFDLVTHAFYTYDPSVARPVARRRARAPIPARSQLYAAHMVLRQVDWSIRAPRPRPTCGGARDRRTALLDAVGAG